MTHPMTAALICKTQARNPFAVSSGRFVCGPAEREMLSKLRGEHKSLVECGKIMGYSTPVIGRWVAEMGLPGYLPALPVYTAKQIETIRAARADGWDVAVIAKHMGVPYSVLFRFCRDHRIPAAPRRWTY